MKKISDLGLLSNIDDGIGDLSGSVEKRDLHIISFSSVYYAHDIPGARGEKFVVGPVSVDFNVGEVVFIVGGNGSGKSTLLKLITGLYSPSDGRIEIDESVLDKKYMAWYREQFSAVFFDFHLFRKQFLLAVNADREKVIYWMNLFGLNVALLESSAWLGAIPLSQGQQRRLALISALISDRKFFVFDEWAADQDKQYREFFYHELIPNLKRQGKCVIVVSHDESFFDVADKFVKMDKGKVIVDVSAREEAVLEDSVS